MIPNRGAFAEYLITDVELLIHIPKNLPFDGAAGIGVAGFTTFQMLYQSQSLATPLKPITDSTPVRMLISLYQDYRCSLCFLLQVLVWSGATAVGQYVIQVAKASGYTVITTASERHHDWLKKLGADVVFDYKDSDVGHKIREYTEGKLQYALDCISEYDSPQKVSDSLSPSGGMVSVILPYKTIREEVKVIHSLAYTLFDLVSCSASYRG
jgi:NADPH:quinone reductase-like Zn-dependent oxidoreductase